MADEISVLSERLLLEARVLGMQVDSIRMRDLQRGQKLLDDIVAAISGASEDHHARRPGAAVERFPADDVEGQIVEFLSQNADAQSVEQIFQFLQEFFPDIRKPSLNVRLHRMANAQAIQKAGHGHYTVSELMRRRAMAGR